MPTHPLTLDAPSLRDELDITSFHGQESLGRLFQYDLELFSVNEEINIDDILGQNVTVVLELEDDEVRYFNAIVSSFSQTGQIQDGGAIYHATLRPWLWFLTRTADCRIFEQMSVPDIVKQVLEDQGFSDIRDELTEEHNAWDYCVQYRETDFNFVSRLMEEEGIYYYFTHENGKHTFVFSDSYSAHEKVRDEAVMYYPVGGGNTGGEQCVSSWLIRREVQPGAYALNDYDFRRPNASLRVREQIPKEHAGSEYEIYDYPGEYADRFEGNNGVYADLRIQELHVQQDQVEGIADLRVISTGGLFELDNHPRNDQNKEYLVISAAYEISFKGGGDEGGGFQCQFTAIDSQVPFRPGRITRKPVVQGPQTAEVVDDAADEYGRVKVKFHWDRDEDVSCWVRVSQNMAGNGWGSMFVPHVGHEVIVSFLEGDPDRPIITGRVYNADNMPPDLWSGSTDNSVITDHVENKINLDGAGTPIIHITQPSGNEILMNDEEGIQLRDHYGNEIVMDAQAGTIKIHSPSHESEITLGQSIVEKTTSDKKSTITGTYKKEIGQFTEEIFVGNKNTQSLALTTSIFVGLKLATSMAVDISKNFEHRIIRDNKVEHKLKRFMEVEANEYIDFQVGETVFDMSKPSVWLESGGSRFEIKKGADITMTAKEGVVITGKDGVNIDSPKNTVIEGKKIVLIGDIIEIG